MSQPHKIRYSEVVVQERAIDKVSATEMRDYIVTHLAPDLVGRNETEPVIPAYRRSKRHEGFVSRFPPQFQEYLHEVSIHLGHVFHSLTLNHDTERKYPSGEVNIGFAIAELFEKGLKQLTDSELLVLGYLSEIDGEAFSVLFTRIGKKMEDPNSHLSFEKDTRLGTVRCPFIFPSREVIHIADKRRTQLLEEGAAGVVVQGAHSHLAEGVSIECRNRGLDIDFWAK